MKRDVLPDRAPQQLLDAGDGVVEVDEDRVADALAGEREQLVRERSGAVGRLLDLAEVVAQRVPALAMRRAL